MGPAGRGKAGGSVKMVVGPAGRGKAGGSGKMAVLAAAAQQ